MNPSTVAAPVHPGSRRYIEELNRRRDVLRSQLSAIGLQQEPFTLELGCGHGHFLTAYAQAHPQNLCIGIDIVSERVQRALRKRDRAKLGNLFFLHAEAALFLETLSPGTSFAELFILFPDPWPKLRHHKHRILQTKFLTSAAGRAAPNCQLCFRTDSHGYFEHSRSTLARHPQWHLTGEKWPFEFCTVFQSRSPEYQSLVARRVQCEHHS
jgi:tRNA (guanine-N7-)-methyltransferase